MKLTLSIESFQSWFTEILNQDKFVYLFIFLIAFLIRLLPEIIVPSYPIGYETITYYAPAMIPSTIGVNGGFSDLLNQFIVLNPSLSQFLRSGPLFYVLMWSIIDLFSVDAFVLLKIVGPLLYGCLAISFYFFVRRGLNLEIKTAFLVALFLIFQPAALRLSWDRYRTVLALIFFFVSLVVLKKKNSNTKWVSVSFLGVLTVLSRDYIGLVMFLTVGGYVFNEKKDRLVSLMAMTPSFLFLLVLFDPNWFSWTSISVGNPFGMTDYGWILQDILSITVVCYLLILPLVLKGFKKDSMLTPLVAWLLFASFGILFFPWFAIPGYQRWLMLLVFPFSIYAVRGLKLLKFRKFKKPLFVIYFLMILIIGIGYSSGTFSYVGQLPNSYVPIHLVQSSIPWEEIDEVKNVLSWFDQNALPNSTLLVEERFSGWAQFYLQRSTIDAEIIRYGDGNSPFSVWDETSINQTYLLAYSDRSFLNFYQQYAFTDITLFKFIPDFGLP